MILDLHLLNLLLPTMRLGLLVVRLRKIALPRREESVSPPVSVNDASSPGSSPGPAPPLGSSPAGSAPSGTAPQGGSVRGRGSSRGGRGSAPTPAVTRSAPRGGSAREASRSKVDVAGGLHMDVVLVVDEVPPRRLQLPGLLRAYPLQIPSGSFVASPTRSP